MKRSFALLISLTGLFAQQPEYWPLAPGNQWVYRASLGEPQTVSVERNETINGRTYAVVTGLFGQTALLRRAGDRLMILERDTQQERLYLDFGAALEAPTPSAAHPCNGTAAITSREGKETLPLGFFENLLAVRYGASTCADAGLTQDVFLPNVGLMRRVETSFTGPRSYDLVHARINGAVVLALPETGFAVHTALDSRGWLVRLNLRHTAGQPLKLEFASGQLFDIVVKNEQGEGIYRWSADKAFPAVLQTIEVTGDRSWATVIPGFNRAGRYTVEAWLTTLGAQPFRASTEFTVEVGIGQP